METQNEDDKPDEGNGPSPMAEEPSFFGKVVKTGESCGRHNVTEDFKIKWSNAYTESKRLEDNTQDKTFLFSAQHKDCIIISTILTTISNSENIIWRPATDVITDDNTTEFENQKISASLSLLDWQVNESANSFLDGASSVTNKGVCKTHLENFMNTYNLRSIINKYYNKLEKRYLCLFEFDEEQLKKNVQLTKPFGELPKDKVDDIKKTIENIKKGYEKSSETCDYSYQNQQELQSRIVPTIPTMSHENMYKSYILEPNNNDSFSKMKNEIILKLSENAGGKRRRSRKSKRKSKKSKRKSHRRRTHRKTKK